MEVFCIYRKDRLDRTGGGLILYIKDSIQSTKVSSFNYIDFDESVWCKLNTERITIGGSLLQVPE